MRTHTKKTGKEELIIIPVQEGYEKKKFSKKTLEHFEKKGFTGKKLTHTIIQDKPQKLFIGTGKEIDSDTIRKIAGKAAKIAREEHVKNIAIDLRGLEVTYTQAAIEGVRLGLYTYEDYKKRDKDAAKDPTELSILCDDEKTAGHYTKKANVLAESVWLVRDLVNKPASDKYPKMMAETAKELGKKYGFDVKIMGRKELEKLGFAAMLGVARGSDKEAQLAILELNPKNTEKPVVLAGKGVTFDAGGLQIKPGNYMLEMKMDMGGAATVLGTMVALCRLGHNKRVIGMLGLVENMLGDDAYKPGDILTAYNGKTIEVRHTDAEGRLVLADVMSYAEKNYEPACIIDLATLTGATIIALGYRIAAVVGRDRGLIEGLKKTSEETQELIWELPLYEHHKKMMQGSISDLSNIHHPPSSMGGPGTITAAAFLSEFVTEKTPWMHLDIAGTAYSYEETEYVSKGGTGWGVRLLTQYLMKE